MPQQYDNEMRFALFKNDKQGNEKRPDYRGTMQVAGVDYELSAWIKTGKSGDKFMSGQVQPKKDRQQAPQRREQPSQADLPPGAKVGNPETDDVPF